MSGNHLIAQSATPQSSSLLRTGQRSVTHAEISVSPDYAGQGTRAKGGRAVECLGLPRPLLEKFYHRNAQRLMPGLPGD